MRYSLKMFLGRESNLLPPPPPPTIMAREFTNSSYKGGPPPGFQVRDNRAPPGERYAIGKNRCCVNEKVMQLETRSTTSYVLYVIKANIPD